jgi:hypothetical protein
MTSYVGRHRTKRTSKKVISRRLSTFLSELNIVGEMSEALIIQVKLFYDGHIYEVQYAILSLEAATSSNCEYLVKGWSSIPADKWV